VIPDAWLFADYGAGPVPVRRNGHRAGGQDPLPTSETATASTRRRFLPGRQGSSDDRYSSVSSWEVAYASDELAKKLDTYLGSGRLIDIVPVRRGVSGRVTEIRITRVEGLVVIRGFSIRTALGLKENLFTIDRQKDRSGALKRVVFNGRGWGHGVACARSAPTAWRCAG
jgi:peptidoglycan hydrolase-like amidase